MQMGLSIGLVVLDVALTAIVLAAEQNAGDIEAVTRFLRGVNLSVRL